MTGREKLIELLHKGVRCPGVIANCEGDCPYWSTENACDEFAATVDMLIANGVVVREWIPVTERLPEADAGNVLVVKNYRGKTYVDIGEIIEGDAYCYSDDCAIHPREHKLTHWMPLPKPPKEEV